MDFKAINESNTVNVHSIGWKRAPYRRSSGWQQASKLSSRAGVRFEGIWTHSNSAILQPCCDLNGFEQIQILQSSNRAAVWMDLNRFKFCNPPTVLRFEWMWTHSNYAILQPCLTVWMYLNTLKYTTIPTNLKFWLFLSTQFLSQKKSTLRTITAAAAAAVPSQGRYHARQRHTLLFFLLLQNRRLPDH